MSSAPQATIEEFERPQPEVDFDDAGSYLTTPRVRLRNESRRQAREWYWSEYDREAYDCPVCGSDGPFDVHHRDGNALNNHPLNLIAICYRCHRSEHRTRASVQRLEDWKSEYSDLFGGAP